MNATKPMSDDPQERKFTICCQRCGRDNVFDQPYAYHAGFADQGFLYSDSGHCTLVWSWFDPAVQNFFPPGSSYTRDADARALFEQALRPAPDGGRWRFTNRPRCIHCSEPIGGSMLEQIHYLGYPDSIVTDDGGQLNLGSQLLS